VNAAGACIELGSYVEAERALDDALVSARQMGLPGVCASALHHQGMLIARLGDPRSALKRADEAIDAFVAQGDRRMEAAARLYRGLFLSLAKELERAEHEVKLALEHTGTTAPLQAYGRAILARIHLEGRHPDAASTEAREAMSLLEGLGGVEEGEAFIRLTFAEALEAIGDHAAAIDAIRAARVRILERTAMIQDTQWKNTFTQKVRENLRTLELALTWGVAPASPSGVPSAPTS
jgi:tetratricopeptide (TPR) repeat protein